MNTRVCKKCGWVYPATQPGTKCVVCGEPFDEVICRTCGKLVSGKDRVPKRNQCKACHNAEERMHMIKYDGERDAGFEIKYKEWLARIAAVPKNYPTLTEEQWMNACRHFRGCAQCGNEAIEARGLFIAFADGGRYCDWNVVPLCDKCASEWKKCPNPFRLAWTRDNNSRSFNRRECLERISKYLGGKLDNAIKAAKKT